MKKVKVNYEVAERLNGYDHLGKNYAYAVYKLLDKLTEECIYVQDWFDNNEMTMEKLEKAFRYGWEIEEKFKKGDLVRWKRLGDETYYYRIVETMKNNGELVEFTNGNQMETKRVELVCEAKYFQGRRIL